jgi:hypothetical protein
MKMLRNPGLKAGHDPAILKLARALGRVMARQEHEAAQRLDGKKDKGGRGR